MSLVSFFDFSFKNFVNLEDESSLSLKNETRLFYLSLISSIIAVYILSIQNSQFALLAKQILFMIVPILLGLRSIYLRQFNIWYFFASVIVLGYSVIFKRFDALSDYVLISWCYFTCLLKPKIEIKYTKLYGVAIILCLIVAAHLSIFEIYGRRSIGGLDPNYSSFLIFLLYPLALYLRSWVIFLVISALGLATESRAFFVALVVLLLSTLLLKIFKKIRISFVTFSALFFSGLATVICYSYYAMEKVRFVLDVKGANRFLLIFNNYSDTGRWNANIKFFDWFFLKDINFLAGLKYEDYFSSVYLYMPHNLPLLAFASYGFIIGKVFFLIFWLLLKKTYNQRLLAFFLSIQIYWLFLGIEAGAIYNVLMFGSLICFKDNTFEGKTIRL